MIEDAKEKQIYDLSRENFQLRQENKELKEMVADKVMQLEKKSSSVDKSNYDMFEQMNRMVLEWQFWEDDSNNSKRKLVAKEKQLEIEIAKRKEIEEKYKSEFLTISNENKRLLREVETLNMEVDFLGRELEKRTTERDVALHDLKKYEDNGGREEMFIKYFEGME